MKILRLRKLISLPPVCYLICNNDRKDMARETRRDPCTVFGVRTKERKLQRGRDGRDIKGENPGWREQKSAWYNFSLLWVAEFKLHYLKFYIRKDSNVDRFCLHLIGFSPLQIILHIGTFVSS